VAGNQHPSGRESEDVDVVVVGAGTAAFAAAVSARQHGAQRVVMLEKAPEAQFGGNARFSPTMFRFVHRGKDELREFLPELDAAAFNRMHVAPYSADDFVRDLFTATRGRVNRELARTLARESNGALHWMLDQSVRWEATGMTREVDGLVYFDDPGYVLSPVGGGLGLLHHWRNMALRLAVDIRYQHHVTGFLGNDRQIDGVRCAGPEHDYELRAAAVILGSGGFQANPEQRARYLGRNADLMRVQGSQYDTGEVLMAALQLGAATAGQWNGADAASVDGTFPEVEPVHRGNRRAYELGITVNIHGQRFFDEAMGESDTRDTPWSVLSQPGGVAFQIVDRTGAALLPPEYQQGAPGIEADSVRGLAEKLGVDAAGLLRTVEEFNASVPDDATPDGKSTRALVPPKSHWAERLDQPPFTGFPVTAGITFTFGGLEVNSHAQVMNRRGVPIRGLYASGDIVGLYYHHHHLAASGQTRNVVFSRLAAMHCMEFAHE
jgi:tricarballylate dehydrogenase